MKRAQERNQQTIIVVVFRTKGHDHFKAVYNGLLSLPRLERRKKWVRSGISNDQDGASICEGAEICKMKERKTKEKKTKVTRGLGADVAALMSNGKEEQKTSLGDVKASEGEASVMRTKVARKKRSKTKKLDSDNQVKLAVEHSIGTSGNDNAKGSDAVLPVSKPKGADGVTRDDCVVDTESQTGTGENSKRKKKRAKRSRGETVPSNAPTDVSLEATVPKKRRKTREEPDVDINIAVLPSEEDRGDQVEAVEGDEMLSLEKEVEGRKGLAKETGVSKGLLDETDPRLGRTLFVGNISQKATSRDVKKLFKPFGKVETVRIRGVVPVNPKIPKRTALLTKRFAEFSDSFQAYVVFEDAGNVTKILDESCQKLNMTVFMERHIRVMPASHQRHGPRKQSLFLGNLPFDCSEEEVITTFKQIADKIGVEIVNARVNRDKDTGVGRGVGFITFNDSLGVQGCINAMGDVEIRGRVIRMEPASKMKKTNTKTFRKANAGNKKNNTKQYWKGVGSKYLSGKGNSKAQGRAGW